MAEVSSRLTVVGADTDLAGTFKIVHALADLASDGFFDRMQGLQTLPREEA